MPIGLARAYGGSEWRDNPYGRGHRANTDDFEGAPLPNVELPDPPMLKPPELPATATLGPHPPATASRPRRPGTPDAPSTRARLPTAPDAPAPPWDDRLDPPQRPPAHGRAS